MNPKTLACLIFERFSWDIQHLKSFCLKNYSLKFKLLFSYAKLPFNPKHETGTAHRQVVYHFDAKIQETVS